MPRVREFDTDTAVDRAVETFWKHGYDGTGMQDLCAAMDLHSGSIYAAFGDKRGLYLAAMDRYIDTVSRDAIARISGAPSGLDGIRAYFDHLVDAIVDGKRRWGCLITNAVAELAQRDPEIATKIAVHLSRVDTAFQAALARAQAEGALAKGVGPEKSTYLLCVLQGLNVLAKTQPPRPVLEAIVDTALAGLER
ncbi:MAG TPA: TetR/AcrR family transcriptional regulator [Burkholderiales bacterium]|nr:TetR/AcrR family transcriptional regulator [Burkholderiales bacterium]